MKKFLIILLVLLIAIVTIRAAAASLRTGNPVSKDYSVPTVTSLLRFLSTVDFDFDSFLGSINFLSSHFTKLTNIFVDSDTFYNNFDVINFGYDDDDVNIFNFLERILNAILNVFIAIADTIVSFFKFIFYFVEIVIDLLLCVLSLTYDVLRVVFQFLRVLFWFVDEKIVLQPLPDWDFIS